jgi:small-conductance mechanosensitive channel
LGRGRVFAFLGQKEIGVYVSGVVAVLLLLFAVLMMLGVVPMTPIVVGAMFIGVCLGFAGPYIIRTA